MLIPLIGTDSNYCLLTFLNVLCICLYIFSLNFVFHSFQDPSKDDGGAYKCHMINEHGELNANLNLDIQGKTGFLE